MGRPLKVTDLEILDYFVKSAEPVFAPVEIYEYFDSISKETARNRLEALVSKGYLSKKKPSSRVTMYWITPKGHSYYENHYEEELR